MLRGKHSQDQVASLSFCSSVVGEDSLGEPSLPDPSTNDPGNAIMTGTIMLGWGWTRDPCRQSSMAGWGGMGWSCPEVGDELLDKLNTGRRNNN